jgi:hypothetical protein
MACGPEQPQGIPPLELCLPADVSDLHRDAIDRGVEAVEAQAGVDAFEVVPGGHCNGAWGTVDVFIRDDSPNGEMSCQWWSSTPTRKRCKMWLPREWPDDECGVVLVPHELGHLILGSKHWPGTVMSADCDDAARTPYFSHEQVGKIRGYFLRSEHVTARDEKDIEQEAKTD